MRIFFLASDSEQRWDIRDRRLLLCLVCGICHCSSPRPSTPLRGLFCRPASLGGRQSSSLYRLVSFTEFASCVHSATWASLVTAARHCPSRVLITSALTGMHAGCSSHAFEFCEISSFWKPPSLGAFTFAAVVLVDLALCLVVGEHASTEICVHLSTGLAHLVDPGSSLSLVLQALLAPFRRLPFLTAHRESCLCTWRLTCSWTL